MTAAPVPSPAPADLAPPNDWVLTAPWWHWPRQAPTQPAQTTPAIQKYATARLVDEFLADPQRRLVFDAIADVTAPPPYDPVTLAPTAGSGTLRKLYLPTHHRSYLVVVELHCDRPGLPSPDRSVVCEAGFVIRRRRPDVPAELVSQARTRLRAVARIRAQLGVIDRRLARYARAGRIGLSRLTALAEQRDATRARLSAEEDALRQWAQDSGVAQTLQGWVPLAIDDSGALAPLPERPGPGHRPLPGLGRWVPVEELSTTLEEAVFPLYPLIPDRRDVHHDGIGRTIFFGVIPTVLPDLQQLDALPAGQHNRQDDPPRVDRAPRLDDLSSYEIRCVVRRHDPRCPRQPGTRDCHGPLVWSEATAPFRLAGPLDPRGTANRPVTIRLPSQAELADAAALPAGLGGVRIAAADYPTEPGGGGSFQICSFAIPLITIIATFVLRLFLPIVVFLFGLWVLLALKLCIPPSLSVSAGLDAALNADLPPPSFEANFGAEVSGKFGFVGTGLESGFGKAGLAPDPKPNLGDGMSGQPTARRFQLIRALATNTLRAPTDDLVYEPRVEREEVFAP